MMMCESIIEKIRIHAVARIQAIQTTGGCKVMLPIQEPSGDIISVVVERDDGGSRYRVTDGGRINGLLFASGPAGSSAVDRHEVRAVAERASLTFDDDRRNFYVHADDQTLAYWVFEVGRSIATVAGMIPRGRRRTRSRRLSTQVIAQLNKELLNQGLRDRVIGPRRVQGVTMAQRRVDLTYRAGAGTGHPRDVFVIAADLGQVNPLRPAQRSIIAAHDLQALEDRPMVRIVHGLVDPSREPDGLSRAESARRLIVESAAAVPGIEQYPWDDVQGKSAFVEVIRGELALPIN